jgi:hypothetical protein
MPSSELTDRCVAKCDTQGMSTSEKIDRVLAGQASYDELGERAQAMVRVAWDKRMAERIDGLDFTERLRAAGLPWSEADDDGSVVMRDAGPPAPGA